MKYFNLTKRDIVNAINGVVALGKLELPVKPAFAISKTKRKLQRHGDSIEDDRMDLLLLLCNTRDNGMTGKPEVVRDDDGEPDWLDNVDGPIQFAQQYASLLDEVVPDVPFHQMPLSAIKRYRVQGNVLAQVPWLFSDYDEETVEASEHVLSGLLDEEALDPTEEKDTAKKPSTLKKVDTKAGRAPAKKAPAKKSSAKSSEGPKSGVDLEDPDWDDPTE